jgi:hypothetical protein
VECDEAPRFDMTTGLVVDRDQDLVRPEVPPQRIAAGERRDVTVRCLRDAVALWFGIHPAALAVLNPDLVERMALRLEGRRPSSILDRLNAATPPPRPHPWAG